ncbi:MULTISPECIES: PAS domain-containing protein [unclassified Acidovorax]|uniref:PAS domain-containing protein n=1 Tax=unclassified Acidovorax TaxID=2684926 RepID=UPI002882F52F|nr:MULTISPECIES: PAS domain-containing protein [unclassified Acidovorax]
MKPHNDPTGAPTSFPFLQDGGEMGARMRSHDWSASPLGTPASWPQSLRTMAAACLNSPLLGTVLWGPELVMLYNDAYIPSMADRHPGALGRPVADVWGPTWQQVAAPFIEAMKTGKGFEQRRVEISMVRDGQQQTTWWDITATPIRGEDGSVVGLLNQGIEITTRVHLENEQLRAQQELSALNQTLETRIAERTAALLLHENIVQSHSWPICAFNLKHELIAFNKAHSDEFFRIYGHRVQIGEVFPDLFTADQAPVMRALMDRALAGESYTVEQAFGDPALSTPVWQVSCYPLRDAEGGIMGAFHHAKDISEQLRNQADLQSTQDALRQSQKMESVGQLTGGLAHDFNNLLAGITGALELIKRRSGMGRYDDIERYVTVGLGAAQRAAALTHRLLAFSRRQTLEPKVLATNRLIGEMEDLIRRTIGPQIDLEVVAGIALWPVMADVSQLENALLNLCINARDAMPNGGKLTIETANRSVDERSAKAIGIDVGQYVSMCVSDNGVGMAPEVAARAFDPFFTTKPIGLGTGLGLSMIYGYAKQSGGHARIYSEVGEGTMVCLYLPRYLGAETETVVARAGNAPAVQGKGQVILVVDDEASVRLFVREILVELGFTVLEAADGIEALQVLQTQAHLDLLITDVGLPGGMNGRQVADAARVAQPDLQILFITGYAENAVLSHGHLAPRMHVMTKPFELSAFVSRVERLLKAPTL